MTSNSRLLGVEKAGTSNRFHNTLANAIATTVATMHQQTDINLVALSGGCFQNKYLLEQTVKLLLDKQFKVLTHKKVPANDGGIALGQLAIASHLRKGWE